jgi:hypothetical protein
VALLAAVRTPRILALVDRRGRLAKSELARELVALRPALAEARQVLAELPQVELGPVVSRVK